jgi:hypothetical protein
MEDSTIIGQGVEGVGIAWNKSSCVLSSFKETALLLIARTEPLFE